MSASRVAAAFATLVALFVTSTRVGAMSDETADRAALAAVSTADHASAQVVDHRDLTAAFGTRSDWTLVVVANALDDSRVTQSDDAYDRPISICLVRGTIPDCSQEKFRAWYRSRDPAYANQKHLFFEYFKSRVVHTGDGRALLNLELCTQHAFNGDCGVSTFLLAYDRPNDRFRVVLGSVVGRNNNQETRFIDHGPLRGAVVVAEPTVRAPFVYSIEVHRPAADGTYRLALQYRGRTGYEDGNPLPVIDSEMPTILSHFGVWKPGDPPPMPPALPEGCSRVQVRRGVEWCAPR
jgi:hypothetical protein